MLTFFVTTIAVVSLQKCDATANNNLDNNDKAYSLQFPLNGEQWEIYGNVTNLASRRSVLMKSWYSEKKSAFHIGSIWNKTPFPAEKLTKDINWEIKVSLRTSNTPTAYHQHGFGIWLAAGNVIDPELQWNVKANRFTGIGIYAAEYGDFADSSSQIVDVYGLSTPNGRLDGLDTLDSQQMDRYPNNMGRCSINSWDVHQRQVNLIARKRGSIFTVKFSACDDFDIDLSELLDACLQKKLRSTKFYFGLSFWSNFYSEELLQLDRFEFSREKKGHKWVFHDDSADEFHHEEDTNEQIFDFPHREEKVNYLCLLPPFEEKSTRFWSMIGKAAVVKTIKAKQLLRLTGVEEVGVGAVTTLMPIERRLLKRSSAWQSEFSFKVSSTISHNGSSAFVVWLATENPLVINRTVAGWKRSFTGLGVLVDLTYTPDRKGKLAHVSTVIGKRLAIQWGENALRANWGVKCIVHQLELRANNYIIRFRKRGENIFASLADCLLVFDISALRSPSTLTLPLLHLGAGASSQDFFNYRDLQSIKFSEVIRVAPSAPVFANVINSNNNKIVEIMFPDSETPIELDCQPRWTFPKPNVMWSKKMTASSSNEEEPLGEDSGVLTLFPDDGRIGDQYFCMVENELGNITRVFKVTAMHSVTVAKQYARKRFWVLTGSFFSGILLTCLASLLTYCLYRRKMRQNEAKNKENNKALKRTRQSSSHSTSTSVNC